MHPPATPSPAPALVATGLAHQYQPTWWCLRDIEFTLTPGQFTGMVGPNGSGKSTLMRALAGQFTPKRGRVELDGRPLARWERRALARRLAWLPQEVAATFPFTVEQAVGLGRYPHLGGFGLLGEADRRIVREAMRWTAIDALAHRTLDELSGGERQRVWLASILAQQSACLLLDEPTTALDIHHQFDLFARLRELAAAGYAVLVITHDLNLAAQFCTRLVVLHEGRIHSEGPPEAVLNPATLSEVYDTRLEVVANPSGGKPLVVPALTANGGGAGGFNGGGLDNSGGVGARTR